MPRLTIQQIVEILENDWEGLRNNDDQLPCYILRYTVNDENFTTKELIRKYIKAARIASSNRDAPRYTNLFSVTDRDEYKDVWLEVAKDMKLTVIKSKSIHGNYYGYAIFDSFEGKKV